MVASFHNIVLNLVLCLALVLSIHSQSISFLNDPDFDGTTSFYLLHPRGNRSLYGPVGPSSSDWKVAQWQIPTELDSQSHFTPICGCDENSGKKWVSSTFNDYAAVCVCESHGNVSFVLHQNGNDIACGKYSSTEEFDTFVSPLASFLSSKAPSIADMSSLEFSVQIDLDKLETHSVECGPVCGGNNNVTYSSVLLSIILRNEIQKATLFVQVILLDTRSGICPGILDPCQKNQLPQWFFHSWPSYGVNFGVEGSFPPLSCMKKAGASVNYRGDLVPALLRLRTETHLPSGFDDDWAHWKVSSLYVGTLQQGKIESTISVASLDLRYKVK